MYTVQYCHGLGHPPVDYSPDALQEVEPMVTHLELTVILQRNERREYKPTFWLHKADPKANRGD